ncbi:Rrf2 family transcriptional regulator [Heliobacterium undosum]|uniref:Rrf2 family transcriptional regulator n=1 Tax=Heliomicrobium undosum TaxID=121734 RepID=A0A845L3X2_9FIRM|nr:Rrf2 family transcriptional regulator [Heliomicrobium undosum]MZP30983.1 Rrf2 family transcriptional regulator [Heliomicrobium undosum]
MKLSTKGQYGVRAMFELAMQYGQGPVSLKLVAERQDISEHYLEQIIAGLRKAGLVNSIRGAQGGYVLAREPAEITVGDIIRVLEGPVAPVDCVNDDIPERCTRASQCISKRVWAKVRDSIEQVIDSITLADMCKDAEKMKYDEGAFMYHI